MAMAVSGGRWTRVRTLGRGASGAEVFLAADHDSGELFAVKSAPAASAGAELLRRERGLMAGLRSPHVVPCIGGRGGRDGSYQLFLEFAPGGSLADAVARNGGRGLDERAVAAYAADVAAGLAYVHGAGLVHGDVKPRNVVIGGDGRAKLADFGCARMAADGDGPIGGTPAFMAPEVARGEAQGPPADVWALGCTVIEMATGRAPWAGVDDVLAAVRLIGYTDAVPEVPRWLSAEAKDFLGRCLARRPSDRATAVQLLEHPFIASASGTSDCRAALDLDAAKGRWVSPKSTLDAAFWESDSDDDHHDVVSAQSTAERIGALACPSSALPDWDSDEGWIDVLSAPAETSSSDATNATADEDVPCIDDGGAGSEEEARAEAAEPLDIDVDGAHNVGETDASPDHERHLRVNSPCDGEVPCKLLCDTNNAMDFVLAPILLCSSPLWICRNFLLFFFQNPLFLWF
ncbi:mitogen-activated protein kinase kinase kinase 18-like [Miscanthus floridulus]|uniref:mitogen-activated protein kinase kinase kinase 18-like n=1 Tax=Miscanthus floridulus TaxID=154761 RepID=UPI00345AB1CC